MKQSVTLVRKADTVTVSIIMLVISAGFVALGGIGIYSPFSWSNTEMVVKVAIPVISILVYLLCILLLYKNLFWVSSIPFVGVMFSVMLSAFQLKSVYGYLEIVIAVVLAVLYCCLMFGPVKHKAIVVILLILAAVYHVVFIIIDQIRVSEFYYFTQLLREMGAVLSFLGFAFAAGSTTRIVPVDLSKSGVVPPPIPGNDHVAGTKNEAVSDPVAENKSPVTAAPMAPSLAETDPAIGNLPETTGNTPGKASPWKLFGGGESKKESTDKLPEPQEMTGPAVPAEQDETVMEEQITAENPEEPVPQPAAPEKPRKASPWKLFSGGESKKESTDKLPEPQEMTEPAVPAEQGETVMEEQITAENPEEPVPQPAAPEKPRKASPWKLFGGGENKKESTDKLPEPPGMTEPAVPAEQEGTGTEEQAGGNPAEQEPDQSGAN